MKKSISFVLFLFLLLSAALALADFRSDLEGYGYKVCEADDTLVLLYEAGPNASLDTGFPPSDSSILNSNDLSYLNQFSRVLMLMLKDGKTYYAAEVFPPYEAGSEGETNGNVLLSSDAITEMFLSGGATVTTTP